MTVLTIKGLLGSDAAADGVATNAALDSDDAAATVDASTNDKIMLL